VTWKTTALSLLDWFPRLTLERVGATTLTGVRGRVYNYSPDELVGGIDQSHRQGIIYADDVTWTPPLLKVGDRVRYSVEGGGTKLLNVESVDDATANVAGESLVFYKVRLKGQ
jgi:hypothetical protein